MSNGILLISGSVRNGSVNSAVIATVADLIEPPAASVTYEGLGKLPHFNPDLDFEPLPEEVRVLRSAITDADALLFSTPEYAGAMPGALKNLLEWTVGGDEIGGKPTGWINPSTSPTKAEKTYLSLATVLEYTEARLIVEACRNIPVPRSEINENGLIEEQRIRGAISEVTSALVSSIG